MPETGMFSKNKKTENGELIWYCHDVRNKFHENLSIFIQN